MIPVDDPLSLSRMFHWNSEPWLNEQAYRETPFHHEYKFRPSEKPPVHLPAPNGNALSALFSGRRSTRAFAEWTMPLATLSNLLHAAYGIVDITGMENGGAYLRRSVPSAGALYPLEIYLLLRRVEGMDDGIYAYDPRGHAIEHLTRSKRIEDALSSFYTYPFITGANAVICYAAVFARCQTKYGPRGYRYILLEAGHSGQNVCLEAQQQGLATLCMGGFKDSVLNACLDLDPANEGVVYSIAVGKPQLSTPK